MPSGESTRGGNEEELRSVSRRGAMSMAGMLGLAGLAGPTVAVQDEGGGRGGSPRSTGEIGAVTNPAFVTNAQGERVPEGDELVFDTGPVSIPLDRFVEADDQYDNTLFPSLNDSRQLVVKPPEGYTRGTGDTDYDAPWPPLRWSDVAGTGGTASVGPMVPESSDGDGGTRITIEVENAIPNAQYTVWVVKFASLKDPNDERFQDNPFVSPAGNGLVGFHNLGQKFGGPGDSENAFTTDENGNGSIDRVNEGGRLSGVPGFNPLGDDPLEDGPVPFVGESEDYEQSEGQLNRIQSVLGMEDQISFVGAYHYDDQTWGVYPGPWHLNQFGVSFVFN